MKVKKMMYEKYGNIDKETENKKILKLKSTITAMINSLAGFKDSFEQVE